MTKLSLLFSVLLLASCGTKQIELSPHIPAQVPTATSVLAVATLEPTNAPSPQSTPTPLTVPSLVWLPWGLGIKAHVNNILTVRDDKVSFEQAPVDIGVFWDYTPLTSRVAYASQAQHADDRGGQWAVSDLWVYNYDTGKTEMWLPKNVARAAWSPTIDPKTSRQYLAAVLYHTTLVLLTSPADITTLSDNASILFSWSPDGRYIACIKNGGVSIITIDGGETRQIPNASIGSMDAGWIGDKPIWMQEQQAIAYSKAPVEIATLNGSRVFTPKTLDNKSPVAERAGDILWSPQKRILVFNTEKMGGSTVWVYELSPDLETIISYYSFPQTDGGPLAWWVSGESILLSSGKIWSISDKAMVNAVR